MRKIPFQNCCRVSSLSQIYEYVRWIQAYAIGSQRASNGMIPPLWFRGQEKADFILLPTLLRDNTIKAAHLRTDPEKQAVQTTVHTQENQRHYAFRSKLNHTVSYIPGPCNQLEWQEYMQHHAIHTRLMDWSETLHSALAFALRALLNPNNDETEKAKRKNIDPVLWVLLPGKLNELVYHSLIDRDLIAKAIQCLDYPYRKTNRIISDIVDSLNENRQIYFDLPKETQQITLNKLINLSVIDQHCASCGSMLPSLLKNGEYNPFHFLLSRYYSHALPAEKPIPPLATLHPYHSDRIKEQHGAFTVFPLNMENNVDTKEYSVLNAMENTKNISQCLFEIRIADANRVAHELLLSGIRESSLFPEPEVFSKEFEAERYYY